MKQKSVAVVGAAETTQLGVIPGMSQIQLHADAALNATNAACSSRRDWPCVVLGTVCLTSIAGVMAEEKQLLCRRGFTQIFQQVRIGNKRRSGAAHRAAHIHRGHDGAGPRALLQALRDVDAVTQQIAARRLHDVAKMKPDADALADI